MLTLDATNLGSGSTMPVSGSVARRACKKLYLRCDRSPYM